MAVEQDTWFIARSADNSVVHYCFCEEGTSFDSGQPIVEQFNNEEEYLNRLTELNINIE